MSLRVFVTTSLRRVAVIAAIFMVCSAVCGQRLITGAVTDRANGEALPGVTVFVQGANAGTTTTLDGTYTIRLPEGAEAVVLRFSFVGYRSQLVQVAAEISVLDVVLRESVLGLDEVVVVGTRRLPRLVKNSVVPVDVLSPRDLAVATNTDLDDVLRTHIPSYNVRRAGGDEAALVRPATLRGLPTDNVVVLINGKRRHRSSSVALSGSALNKGAQGPDMNMIPSIAIKQAEVLRDGASAQYGADAVAGVFNLQLRNAPRGVLIRMQGGQYGQGDGRYGHLAANVGLELTPRGYLSLSLEARDVDPTVRSTQRPDAALLATRDYPVADPAQIIGSPKVSKAWTGFVNAGLMVNDNLRAYTFGGYGQRTSEYGFFFRSPGTETARGSVYRFGTRETAVRAVVDLDENDGVVCQNLKELPSLDADNATVQSFISRFQGECFLFNELFPGGFTPRFGSDMTDWSVVAGIEGGLKARLRWDASVSVGQSAQDYFIYNTINASYGPETPTSFRPRGYLQQEMEASVAMSYPIDVGVFASPLNVAWGLSWRNETFESTPGNLESYNPGPYASQGFSVGSNGYQGLNPNFAGRWSRPNVAAYVDVEADVTDRWVVDVAARYENYYNDFGSTLTGKVGGLYRATDRITFRGTLSTGFRAPTPGQANLNVFQTTGFSPRTGLIEVGQLPSTHPIARGLGGKALAEETARSLSLGTILELSEDLTLTADYFNIAFKNRIAVTGNIPITDEILAIMDEADLLGGVRNVREIRFYSNDFDTRTSGMDLVAAWQHDWGNNNFSSASLAWNWTTLDLVSFAQPRQIEEFLGMPLKEPVTLGLLTPARQVEMQTLSPKHRVVVTGRDQVGPIYGMLRFNYYSSFELCPFGSSLCEDASGQRALTVYGDAVIIAAEVGYSFRQDYRMAIGMDNILDSVPLTSPEDTRQTGALHSRSLPWDFNGRAGYLRLTADLF